jgi:hypothetical protein
MDAAINIYKDEDIYRAITLRETKLKALQCAVECLLQNEKDDEDRNNFFFK